MKRYLFGLIAIITAITCFAVTKSKSNYQLTCNSSTPYAWFHVSSGQSVTTCSTAAIAGKIDLYTTEYIGTPRYFLSHFGCYSYGSYVCIVGYALTDVTTDAAGNYIPKSTAIPICCTFRITNN